MIRFGYVAHERNSPITIRASFAIFFHSSLLIASYLLSLTSNSFKSSVILSNHLLLLAFAFFPIGWLRNHFRQANFTHSVKINCSTISKVYYLLPSVTFLLWNVKFWWFQSTKNTILGKRWILLWLPILGCSISEFSGTRGVQPWAAYWQKGSNGAK